MSYLTDQSAAAAGNTSEAQSAAVLAPVAQSTALADNEPVDQSATAAANTPEAQSTAISG